MASCRIARSPSLFTRKIYAHLPLRSLLFTILALNISLVQPALPQPSNPPESPAAAQVRGLNNALLRLHADMQHASANSAGALRRQAASVIARRAVLLSQLIENEPQAALSFALSPELLADLAAKFPDSAAMLEAHTALHGPVEIWIEHAADLKHSRTHIRMKAETNRTVELYFGAAQSPSLNSGDIVQVTGIASGSVMAVSGTAIASTMTSTGREDQ